MAAINDYYDPNSFYNLGIFGVGVPGGVTDPSEDDLSNYYDQLIPQPVDYGEFDYDPYDYFTNAGNNFPRPQDEFGNDRPADEMLDWYYNNPDGQAYIDNYWAGGNGVLSPGDSNPPPPGGNGSQPPGGNAPPPDYGTGYPQPPGFPSITTAEPLQMSEQDRIWAAAQGDLLDQGFRDSQNTYQNLEAGARNQAYSGPGGYGDILAGNGGFNAEQSGNILQEEMLRNGIASQAELDALHLEPWEKEKILGDPWAAQAIIQGRLANMDTARNEAQTRQREAYTDMGNRLDSAVDPNALRTSAEYNQNFNFGPEDMRGYAEQAARAVSLRSQGERDALMRSGAAQGNVSPLALAAAASRNKLTGDISAGNVYSDALLKGKQLQLSTTQAKEDTRMGAERDLSGRLVNNADLYGRTRLGAEQQIGQDQQNLNRYGTDLVYDATKYGDATQSARAAGLAENRQNIGQANINTRFGQAGTASTALSNRYGTVYGQKKQEEAEGRGFLTGQQDRAQAGSQSAQDRRLNLYGARNSATGSATGRAIQAKNLPTFIDKAAGFAGGLLGG